MNRKISRYLVKEQVQIERWERTFQVKRTSAQVWRQDYVYVQEEQQGDDVATAPPAKGG